MSLDQVAIPRLAAKTWGIAGAMDTDLAFIKTLGWYIAVYAAMLLSLLQVHKLSLHTFPFPRVIASKWT